MDPTPDDNISLELTLSTAESSGDAPSSPAMGAEEYVKVLEEEEKTIKALEPGLPLCKRLLAHAIEVLKKKKKKRKNTEKMESCAGGKRSSLRIFGKLVVAGGDDGEEKEEQGGGGGEPQEVECKANYQGNKWIISTPDKESFPSNGNAIAPFGGFFPFAAISEEEEPRFVLQNFNLSAIPGGGWTSSGAWASGSGSKPAPLAAGHHAINSQSHHRPPTKKARLCWTAELHRRFLSAIEQLGGDQAATPKRIKDLMKVDGITSDQVRSHLQKYRLSAQKALDSSDTTTSNDSGVPCNNVDCVEQQSVRQFGFPQLPADHSAQEMLLLIPVVGVDAGDSRRQEEDED